MYKDTYFVEVFSSNLSIYIHWDIYTNMEIYIYIYIKKPTLLYVTAVNIKKPHIFSHRYISELYFFVIVCVCVKNTCWKFSIFYKSAIKKLLKLTMGITWRHSNIILKLEKIKSTNLLKNLVQLGEEINSTKGTKQLQNKKATLNIKWPAYHNWQTGVDNAAWIKKIYSPPTVA